MAIQDYIKNASVVSGAAHVRRDNTPPQYKDRQKRYFADVTALSRQQYARYADNYIAARVQGVAGDFYGWTDQLIRMADVYSSSTQKIIDDTKAVLFANPAVDYIPRGAKLEAMGSTWIVTNPKNISASGAIAVVERCNAVWNHLDYYGNVLSEPIAVQKTLAAASQNDKGSYVLTTEGYFNFKAQMNDATRELRQNTRIILGSGAYELSGITDFIREFTNDPDSSHFLEFTGHYTEPNETDDMVNQVAGGLSFSWQIAISGSASMAAGQVVQFSASSSRNGETIASTEEHPISYNWTSSDESVATVDAQGVVSAVSEGQAVISCALSQNAAKSAVWPLVVTSTDGHVAFITTPPTAIAQYDSVTLTAAYYENGAPTAETVAWSFSGASTSAYSKSVNGNSVTITCYAASATPLTVTATCEGEMASTTIQLTGM